MNPAWAIPSLTAVICAGAALFAKHTSRAVYHDCHQCGHDLNGDNRSHAGTTGQRRHYRCANCGAHSTFDMTTT